MQPALNRDGMVGQAGGKHICVWSSTSPRRYLTTEVVCTWACATIQRMINVRTDGRSSRKPGVDMQVWASTLSMCGMSGTWCVVNNSAVCTTRLCRRRETRMEKARDAWDMMREVGGGLMH